MARPCHSKDRKEKKQGRKKGKEELKQAIVKSPNPYEQSKVEKKI